MKKVLIIILCFMFQLSGFTAFADMDSKVSKGGMVFHNNHTPSPAAGMGIEKPLYTSKDLLQFRAGSHIMGFQPDRVYMVSLDHALIIEFVDTEGVIPQVRTIETKGNNNGLSKLGKVEYPSLWEGITVRYESIEGSITESTYMVEPNADAKKIRLRYNTEVEIQSEGSLRYKLPTKRGWMTESKPVAWQEIDGKRIPVDVAFNLNEGIIGFSIGHYDKTHALIIDPAYQWHTFYGSESYDYGYGIAVDGSGNVYITGSTAGTWQGDGGANPLHAYSGNGDIVVLKLNSAGAYQWHTFYGSSGYWSVGGIDTGISIVVDGSSNVYITGLSDDTWQGDGGANPLHAHSGYPSKDMVVLKLNSAGAYQWHTFYGSGNYDNDVSGIAVDGSDNVYITGSSDTTWQGDGGANPLHGHSGFYDIVVLKLNSAGVYQWHTFYGSDSNEHGYGIAVDSSGNVYITGSSDTTWQGDGGVDPLHPYSGNSDVVVLKLTSAGAYQWHTFYGSGSYDYGNGIAVDGSGNVYITGLSFTTWQGDGSANPLHAHNDNYNYDMAMLKLNSAGTYQWHTFYGSGNYDDYVSDITVDGSGNVYIIGSNFGSWQGDGGANPLHANSGGGDIVVLKLTSAGVYQWHTFYGSGSYDYGNGIAVDWRGYVYVTGSSWGTWQGDDGANPLHAYSGSNFYDIVVLNLARTGSIVINGGAEATKSTWVTLTLTASDDGSGPIQMCISNTTSCPSYAWTEFAATKNWRLSCGEGTKTVYVWFRDQWGNTNTTPYSDTIILDTTAPVNGTVTATPDNEQITLNWSGFADALSDIDSYKVVYVDRAVPLSCSRGTLIYTGTDTSYPHAGLTNGTTYGYRVCAIDKAGNMSSGATATARPVPETNPPAGSIVINGGAEATKSAWVTLTLTASDDGSGPIQMCISNTPSCPSFAWTEFAATKNWRLNYGDGEKTVYIWFRDKWGNTNSAPYSDTIILDTKKR
jgi:hypothetical protein